MTNITNKNKAKGYEGRFLIAICINRMTVFEIEYGAITDNKQPHFSTSASRFVKNKRDWSQCGQCQEEVLRGKAKQFYFKWKKYHLKQMNINEYNEMFTDLKELLKVYPDYIFKDKNYGCYYISFNEIKNLSMKVKG